MKTPAQLEEEILNPFLKRNDPKHHNKCVNLISDMLVNCFQEKDMLLIIIKHKLLLVLGGKKLL